MGIRDGSERGSLAWVGQVCPIEVLPTLRMLREFLMTEGDMVAAAAKFNQDMKDGSATDPARRLRTHNLYGPFLTRLPGEEAAPAAEDDDMDDIIQRPHTAAQAAAATAL